MGICSQIRGKKDISSGKIYPVPTISVNTWLARNPEALASVKRGLKQASLNQGKYLGSFAEFADLDIDDEDTENQ